MNRLISVVILTSLLFVSAFAAVGVSVRLQQKAGAYNQSLIMVTVPIVDSTVYFTPMLITTGTEGDAAIGVKFNNAKNSQYVWLLAGIIYQQTSNYATHAELGVFAGKSGIDFFGQNFEITTQNSVDKANTRSTDKAFSRNWMSIRLKKDAVQKTELRAGVQSELTFNKGRRSVVHIGPNLIANKGPLTIQWFHGTAASDPDHRDLVGFDRLWVSWKF